jgi:hypothetical protein
MKKRIVFMILAALAFSGGLWAQDSGRNFFKSIGLVYTISIGEIDNNAVKSISQSMGINAGLFIFSHEKLGWYINPGALLRMKQGLEEPKNMENMDIYFGAAIGPAFRIYGGGSVDVLAGIGPDIACVVRQDDYKNDKFESTETFLGLGLGGSLEARLKLYKTIALTGGILMKYNFVPYAEDRAFFIAPYIGIGF